MKICGFNAKIKTLEYKEIEPNPHAKNKDLKYVAQCQIIEIKRGRNIRKTMHNAGLFLTKEQFDAKILDIGDVVEICDGVNFACNQIMFNVYDAEKIKAFPASRVKTDKNGTPYVPQRAFAYTVRAAEGQWHLKAKFTELYYWQFGKIKIPMNDGITEKECEDEFRNQTSYEFYLTKDEYEKVKEFNGDFVVNGYKRGALAIKQPFRIEFEEHKDIERWKVTMTKIEVEG